MKQAVMKFKYFFYLLTTTFLYGQNDSLKKYSYEKLEEKFYNGAAVNSSASAIYAKYYLEKAKLENNKNQISEAYVMLHFSSDFPDALKYIDSLKNNTTGQKEYPPSRIFLLKGNLYFKYDDKKNALNNYILALKDARAKQNLRHIAKAEISIAYLHNFIGKHAETVKTLRRYLHSDFFHESELDDIRLGLADAYIEIKKLDSAKILINEGLETSLKNKNTNQYNRYLLLSGFLDLQSKNYNTALNTLLKSKQYFLTTDDERNRSYSLLYLGYAYRDLNQEENAIKTFSELESTTQKTNYHFPELRVVYTYLIDYYKKQGDKEKQLYYIENFLKIDRSLDSQFRYVSRELPRRYDAPQLLKEKEEIIDHLQTRKIYMYVFTVMLLIIIIVLIVVYIRAKKEEKKQRKIAQDLIFSIEEDNLNRLIVSETFNDNDSSSQVIHQNKIEKTTKSLPEDTVDFILNELENFESKENFLKKGLTLGSLAKDIKTNSSYLSEVINTYKGKNFASYLNDLRIDYALSKLVRDKKFRSYKLSVIATELGYNNEQAFAIAFKKKTGTTLSIYLKEIEKKTDL